MTPKRTLVFFLIISSLLIASCSAGSQSGEEGNADFGIVDTRDLPQYSGYFFVDGKEFIEIPETSKSEDFHTLPHFQTSEPEFLVSEDSFDPYSVFLYDHTGKLFTYSSKQLEPSEDTGYMTIYQITPGTLLPDGFYCFMTEVPVNPAAFGGDFDDNYCFSLGSQDRLGFNIDLSEVDISSNQMGFFLQNLGDTNFIQPTTKSDEFDLSALQITDQLLPAILFQSDSINPDEVNIYWQRSVIGISLSNWDDNGIVSSITPGKGAEAAGMQEGDRIIAINGTDVSDYDTKQITSKIGGSCTIGNSVEIILVRGTQTFTANPTCSIVGESLDGLTYELDPRGFAIFSVDYPLYPNNVYCFSIRSAEDESCFLVQ